MGESILQLSVKNKIIKLFESAFQLSRAEIIEHCLQIASEPTIHKILKNLVAGEILDELEEKRMQHSSGGRPLKHYRLNEKFKKVNYLCIGCLHWDKVSPHRVQANLSTEFGTFRDGGAENYSKWCEIQDKPMFHDEWCREHESMKVLYTFTHQKSEDEVPVGFNGRVSIDFGDDLIISRIYESNAFLVIKSISQTGKHLCYRIYPDLTQSPYPCDEESCNVTIYDTG